jgi:hypothetical protein
LLQLPLGFPLGGAGKNSPTVWLVEEFAAMNRFFSGHKDEHVLWPHQNKDRIQSDFFWWGDRYR